MDQRLRVESFRRANGIELDKNTPSECAKLQKPKGTQNIIELYTETVEGVSNKLLGYRKTLRNRIEKYNILCNVVNTLERRDRSVKDTTTRK